MESVALFLTALAAGAIAVTLENRWRMASQQARARARASDQSPAPLPPLPPTPQPAPHPSPSPAPSPAPEPSPAPQPDYELIPEETWRDDGCWWNVDEPGDVHLELGRQYYTAWPSEWQGTEPHHVYFDPPEVAEVDAVGVWQDGELYIEVVITPRQSGWGYLMATEGTPGEKAVKGEAPWRAECMRVEVS